MKRLGLILILLAMSSVTLSFVHPFGNPRVGPGKRLDTTLKGGGMSQAAQGVLIEKCASCHSNETRWPVYSRLAPGSWLIERDIVEARRKMNLSSWDQMPADAQEIMIGKIIHEAKSGDMPPLQYRLLHWDATLTSGDVAKLAAMQAHTSTQGSPSLAGDAMRGKGVFEKRCTGCHAMDGDREGPQLAGVFGRRAGTVAGFEYSNGLKNSGITWNDATLERWLTDPDMVVPDNKMDFHVPNGQERSDLIAYFKQAKP